MLGLQENALIYRSPLSILNNVITSPEADALAPDWRGMDMEDLDQKYWDFARTVAHIENDGDNGEQFRAIPDVVTTEMAPAVQEDKVSVLLADRQVPWNVNNMSRCRELCSIDGREIVSRKF